LRIAEYSIADCGLRIADCGIFDCGLRIYFFNPQSAIRNPQSIIPQSNGEEMAED
jgi:hypothetical protein